MQPPGVPERSQQGEESQPLLPLWMRLGEVTLQQGGQAAAGIAAIP